MRGVGTRYADEAAYFIEALRRQPAGSTAAAHREAIGLVLIRTAKQVAAFVAVNPQLHRCRHLGDVRHIEDDELRIRRRGIIIEVGVEHCRPSATAHAMAVEHQLAGRHDLGAAAVALDIILRRRIAFERLRRCSRRTREPIDKNAQRQPHLTYR